MVGAGADNSDLDAVLLVPAGKTVNDIDTASGVEVVDSTFWLIFQTSGVMGLLTGPHQMLSFEEASSTIRLSRGDRPVLAPE
jgi:hypothetical protein